MEIEHIMVNFSQCFFSTAAANGAGDLQKAQLRLNGIMIKS